MTAAETTEAELEACNWSHDISRTRPRNDAGPASPLTGRGRISV